MEESMTNAQAENMAEEMTEKKKMSKDDFAALVERAKAIDVHKPNWCIEQHYDLYKICYLMVKEDPACSGMSSSNRKKLIIRMMNQHITATRDILYKKAQEQQAKLKAAQEAAKAKEASEVTNEQPNA